jgi:hypothetical protein
MKKLISAVFISVLIFLGLNGCGNIQPEFQGEMNIEFITALDKTMQGKE